MKVYVSHSSGFNYQDELYAPIMGSELYTQHEFTLPHLSSHELDFSLREKLADFDLVIAEVSYPSTGQGIELGWFSLGNKPIKCIYRDGQHYSSALKAISSIIEPYFFADGHANSANDGVADGSKPGLIQLIKKLIDSAN